MPQPVLALHAGAGSFYRVSQEPERIPALSEPIESIAVRAWEQLVRGATALDVVEAAVRELEDCPLYNAGTGSVLTRDDTIEMDAAIMDGHGRRCGAVAGVRRVKNPVALAKLVLHASPHVLLVDDGAERFAEEHGVALVDSEQMITPDRRAALVRARERLADQPPSPDDGPPEDGEQGTVGAVARDAAGHLSAATSTGGTTGQRPGRVGDSPIIGAGTWADDRTCAVSATGHGEVFIRSVFAHSVHAIRLHAAADLAGACRVALADVAELGGNGGCIALAPSGGPVFAFNSAGMLRAWIDDGGHPQSAIFS